jgi:hypothetical protein
MLDLDDTAHGLEVISPRRVQPRLTKQPFDLGAMTGAHGLEMGDRLATTHDREAGSVMLDRIKQIGEVPRRIGSANV